MRKQKILHIVATLGAGGTEQACLRLADSFNKLNKFQNTFVALRAGDQVFHTRFKELEDGTTTILPTGRLARLIAFRKAVKSAQPDAIIFHMYTIDAALMAVLARQIGIKQMIVISGSARPGVGTADWKVKSILALNRIASCPIIAASSWIESQISKTGPLPQRSRVIYNGIDVTLFRNHRQEVLKQEPGSLWKLGMIARLDAVKDHSTLFDGFALFLEKHPQIQAELRIIGDGEMRKDLETKAKSLGLEGEIIFLGSRKDIPEQLADLDVFVFATKPDEGFGIVLTEALASGVPIIANDVPSSKEVLKDGAWGTLVPSTGPKAWADALEQHWRHGPTIAPPPLSEIDKAYGLAQFRDAYLDVLAEQAT
jgi:glycosyltransferase involved in cell wall biosynthesis